MKKLFVLITAAVALTAAVFAQDEPKLSLSGEAKSGIYWKQSQDQGRPAETMVRLHSRDDAGGEDKRGRFRLNLEYDNGNGFGMKMRFNWEDWNGDWQWPYAFGYGNFFDDQLTVSVGKLGGSPWGTGGPELWKELEQGAGGGMRVEYKPAFIPEQYGKVNVGFVLNYFNSQMDQGVKEEDTTLLELLKESVIGIAYSNDYFLARVAYRFDSEMDKIQGTGQDITAGGGKNNIQDELVYRVEEHVLKDIVPGLQAWALGYFLGISCQDPDVTLLQNWFFTEYSPPVLGNMPTPFTAQLRIGLDFIPNRQVLHIRPSLYWHFFNKLISAGASFQYAQDFGDAQVYEGSPFYYIEIEPKVQINFTSSYIAFVYNWRREYFNEFLAAPGKDPLAQIQYINLRFCIYY